jgi:hypothetical protein
MSVVSRHLSGTMSGVVGYRGYSRHCRENLYGSSDIFDICRDCRVHSRHCRDCRDTSGTVGNCRGRSRHNLETARQCLELSDMKV